MLAGDDRLLAARRVRARPTRASSADANVCWTGDQRKTGLHRERHRRGAAACAEARISPVAGRNAVIASVETDDPIADRSIPLAVERWIVHDRHRRIYLRICRWDRSKAVSERDRSRGDSFPRISCNVRPHKN